MALSRDQLLAAVRASCKTADLVVPEWGDAKIRVRGMTARERGEFLNRLGRGGKPTPADLWSWVVAKCVVDDQGCQLFNDAKDVQAIADGSGTAVERIYDEIAKLSFLGQEGLEAKKGNFGTTPSEA